MPKLVHSLCVNVEKSQLHYLTGNIYISLPATEPRPTHFIQTKLFVFKDHCKLVSLKG